MKPINANTLTTHELTNHLMQQIALNDPGDLWVEFCAELITAATPVVFEDLCHHNPRFTLQDLREAYSLNNIIRLCNLGNHDLIQPLREYVKKLPGTENGVATRKTVDTHGFFAMQIARIISNTLTADESDDVLIKLEF